MHPDGVSMTDFTDLMAGAAASHLSGEPFVCPHGGYPMAYAAAPMLTIRHAEWCLNLLRGITLKHVDSGPMDFLRGAGQMPSLSERIAYVARTISPDDVVNWQADRRKLKVSLRLESYNPSDRPAAYKAQTTPIPRLSHPGRNALAAYLLLMVPAHRFCVRDLFSGPRIIAAPLRPMSYYEWLHRQESRQLAADVMWFAAKPGNNGKVWFLDIPRPVYDASQLMFKESAPPQSQSHRRIGHRGAARRQNPRL